MKNGNNRKVIKWSRTLQNITGRDLRNSESKDEIYLFDAEMNFRFIKGQKQQEGFTDAIESVRCHRLEGPSHHGMLFQNLVETAHTEGVKSTVRICSNTSCPPATCQQTDL